MVITRVSRYNSRFFNTDVGKIMSNLMEKMQTNTGPQVPTAAGTMATMTWMSQIGCGYYHPPADQSYRRKISVQVWTQNPTANLL